MAIDLLLELDEHLGREQAVTLALRTAIRDGRLAAETRLPSSRQLAEELGLARSTVVSAYEQLVAEGFLVARQGTATTVAAVDHSPSVGRASPGARKVFKHDFRPGETDHTCFPVNAWMRSARRALGTTDPAVFGYGDPLGLLDLRTTLADQLRRSRAVDAPASNVVIQSGVAGALRLIAQSLRQLGVETVAFEDPCLPFLPSILRRAGLATEPVPVDGSGLRVDLLEATEATAVLVTPAHQYPTGVPLAPDRRLQLIGWATRRHGWIIEDDYDGEFRYDRRSIGSLQALAPDRVIYLGTASKSVAAGMRTAWAVLPDAVLATIAPAVAGDVSGLEQATFADFVATGAFDRHLRAMRKLYTARRRVLVNALADVPFDLTVLGIPAGLHVPVAWDRDGPDEASLVAAGEEVGMGLIGFGAHFANQTSRAAACPGMVLGFSRQPETGYSNSVERLMELLARFGSA